MIYEYKRLTIDEYINFLYKDGLQHSEALSEEEIQKMVETIGIFRLKGYVKAFKNDLCFYSLDDLLELYNADKNISSQMLSLSSQIEVKLKAYLIETVYELTDNPFFYLLKDSYIENFSINNESIYDWGVKPKHANQNSEVYLHYRDYYLKNYDFEANKEVYLKNKEMIRLNEELETNYPPFHYFVENMTLGALIKLLSKLTIDNQSILKLIANKFSVLNKKVFLNYLLRLKELRNRCAHNGRIFNRNYRSVKAIATYKKVRKEIYHHRLLDVYYTLYFLLNGAKGIDNSKKLEQKFTDEILKDSKEKIRDFIINRMRKR